MVNGQTKHGSVAISCSYSLLVKSIRGWGRLTHRAKGFFCEGL
ncbi:MAG: hypothetical protein PVS3B3_35500 [Ktedonobacteraceae bacterium]